MTWDDHEIRNGWGSERLDGTAANRQAAFAVVREVYRHFQHDHNPPSFGGGAHDFFYAFEYGNAGVLVLDGRGERDIESAVDPLLGARQWKCVKQWLRDETPGLEALFVVASVPPVRVPPELAEAGRRARSDCRDQWTSEYNLPEARAPRRGAARPRQRARHPDRPARRRRPPRHRRLPALDAPRARRRRLLYQLCSSPITNRPPKLLGSVFERIKHTEFDIADGIRGKILAGPLAERNFGVVELAYEPDRYRITLKLFDEAGAERVTYPLPG